MIDINAISKPADIKGLDYENLKLLSEELRAALLKKLSAHGGHVGPNLGVVEATVALHYVFDAPKDKIVFDVSHQSYVHKMLTGRIAAFTDPARYDEVTGYTCPRESDYDLFEIGHTSTSIALAVGLAKARDLSGGKENVIAFIGDASLGGGEALEALDYGPELHSNLIVVVNDNQMSIAENHGALIITWPSCDAPTASRPTTSSRRWATAMYMSTTATTCASSSGHSRACAASTTPWWCTSTPSRARACPWPRPTRRHSTMPDRLT